MAHSGEALWPPPQKGDTGELGYDGPLYDRFLSMTDNMLGPSPMHIKYVSYLRGVDREWALVMNQ